MAIIALGSIEDMIRQIQALGPEETSVYVFSDEYIGERLILARVSSEDFARVMRAIPPHIQCLGLRRSSLFSLIISRNGEVSVSQIMAMIPGHINELDLGDDSFGTYLQRLERHAAMLRAIPPQITRLNLSGNDIGVLIVGPQVLLPAIPHSVRCVNLVGNKFYFDNVTARELLSRFFEVELEESPLASALFEEASLARTRFNYTGLFSQDFYQREINDLIDDYLSRKVVIRPRL